MSSIAGAMIGLALPASTVQVALGQTTPWRLTA